MMQDYKGPNYNLLIEDIKESPLVLFIGAGVMWGIIPLWEDLVNNLFNKALSLRFGGSIKSEILETSKSHFKTTSSFSVYEKASIIKTFFGESYLYHLREEIYRKFKNHYKCDIKNEICPKRCNHEVKCNDEGPKECYKKMHLLHYRPGCITSNEFFGYLKQRISDGTIDRFAFWDLTQIDFRFPFLSDDQMFLPALMDFVKYSSSESNGKKITSIFIGSLYCKLAYSASMMGDNVLLCIRETLTLYHGNNNSIKESLIDGIFVFVDRIEGKPGLKHLVFIELIEDNKFGSMLFLENLNKTELDNTKYLEVMPIEKVTGDSDSKIVKDNKPGCKLLVKPERIKEIEEKFGNLIEKIEKRIQTR